ncbi:MAG: hypothetical protein IKL44_00885 [Clostridia bacterium]|nr:hypothetical protein [Clostridia bacterium]MBR3593206.1 hypothetical protein [Clostridia bacterium]
MEAKFVIQTIIEIALLGAVILTFWKEKALIAFEDKIADKFRSRKRRGARKAFVVHEGGRGAHCA